jgi:hypothetical protein
LCGFQGLEHIVPTSEFIGTGRNYQATSVMVHWLQLLSHQVNAVLEYTDPTHYQEAIKVNQALSKEFPGYRALAVIDPMRAERLYSTGCQDYIQTVRTPF